MDSIILDVDGTLWDSTAEVAEVWKIAAMDYNAPFAHITPERLKQEFGKTAEAIAVSLYPEYTPERAIEITQHACEIENEWLYSHRPSLYDGVKETVIALSEKVPLFIVSNCQAGYIELLIDITGIAPYITDHLCPGDTGLTKAANICKIVQKHRLKSPVYVGDTTGDLAASREAGVRFVYAAYGFGTVDEYDAAIDHPRELLGLYQKEHQK